MKQKVEPYKYKDYVEILALGVVDDLLTVCESGYKAARMNSFINANTAIKKLQFGPESAIFFMWERSMKIQKSCTLCGKLENAGSAKYQCRRGHT